MKLSILLIILFLALGTSCSKSKHETVTIYYPENMGGKNSTFADCQDVRVTPANQTYMVEFMDKNGHHLFAGIPGVVVDSEQ